MFFLCHCRCTFISLESWSCKNFDLENSYPSLSLSFVSLFLFLFISFFFLSFFIFFFFIHPPSFRASIPRMQNYDLIKQETFRTNDLRPSNLISTFQLQISRPPSFHPFVARRRRMCRAVQVSNMKARKLPRVDGSN